MYGIGWWNLVASGAIYQIQKRKKRDGAYFRYYKHLKMRKNANFDGKSIYFSQYFEANPFFSNSLFRKW